MRELSARDLELTLRRSRRFVRFVDRPRVRSFRAWQVHVAAGLGGLFVYWLNSPVAFVVYFVLTLVCLVFVSVFPPSVAASTVLRVPASRLVRARKRAEIEGIDVAADPRWASPHLYAELLAANSHIASPQARDASWKLCALVEAALRANPQTAAVAAARDGVRDARPHLIASYDECLARVSAADRCAATVARVPTPPAFDWAWDLDVWARWGRLTACEDPAAVEIAAELSSSFAGDVAGLLDAALDIVATHTARPAATSV